MLDRVKRDPVLRSIPIAVLTSSDRQQDVDASCRAGSNAYLVKHSSVAGWTRSLGTMSEFWTDVALLPEPPS